MNKDFTAHSPGLWFSALLLPIPLTAELISTFSNETGHLWKWGKQADRPWHRRLGILTSRNYFSYITDRLMWKVGTGKIWLKTESQRRQMEVNTEAEVCELSCIIACMRRQEVIWEEREKIHWLRKMEAGVVEYTFSKHTALKCCTFYFTYIHSSSQCAKLSMGVSNKHPYRKNLSIIYTDMAAMIPIRLCNVYSVSPNTDFICVRCPGISKAG